MRPSLGVKMRVVSDEDGDLKGTRFCRALQGELKNFSYIINIVGRHWRGLRCVHCGMEDVGRCMG